MGRAPRWTECFPVGTPTRSRQPRIDPRRIGRLTASQCSERQSGRIRYRSLATPVRGTIMFRPKRGDVVIRDAISTPGEFYVADAVTNAPVVGPFPSITAALTAARAFSAAGAVWRETSDERGRPLGDPFVLPLEDEERRYSASSSGAGASPHRPSPAVAADAGVSREKMGRLVRGEIHHGATTRRKQTQRASRNGR